jgi:hypothetical protein
MIVPGIVITIFYAGVIMLVIGNIVDPVAAVVATLIANMAAHLIFSTILFRHQKLLEWFAEHIHLTRDKLPSDAPDDLLDFWKDGDD